MQSLAHLQYYQSLSGQALNDAYKASAPVKARLYLQDLLSRLYLSHLAQHRTPSATKTQKVAKELNRLLERLRGRTKLSEAVTLNSFLKLSSEAQDILGSILALETRDQFDDFAQIDFNRAYDHEALLTATERARDWIS